MFSFPKSFFISLALAGSADALDDETRLLQGKKGGMSMMGPVVDPLCPVSVIVPSPSSSGGKKGSGMSLGDVVVDSTCAVGDSMDDELQFGRPLSAPNVIFGSGNADGSFTKSSANGIELALRGKLRYNPNCAPENTFNRIGNAGYNFPTGNPRTCTGNNVGRPTWSYEWSIISDVGCDSAAAGADCTPLNAYDYHLQLDNDRSYCTDFDWTNAVLFPGTIDPVNAFTDVNKPANHLGSANSKQGGGSPQCSDGTTNWTCVSSSRCNIAVDAGGCLGDSSVTYETAVETLTVAQNSAQITFFGGTPDFDIDKPGIYTFKLAAKCKGTDLVIAETYIDIIVGDLKSDFPTSDAACEGTNFSFDGLFASVEECKDFVSRYA